MTKRPYRALLCTLVVIAVGCTNSTKIDEHLPDFLDQSRTVTIGAGMCVTGPFTSKASDLEQSLILLEEFVNGSSLLEGSVDTLACRDQGNCGVFAGTDASGNAIRAPLKIVVGDDAQRDDRSVVIAQTLVNQDQVPVLIGPCTASAMTDIFNEVTGTSTVLISPVVTADSITDLPDHTGADSANGLPGYVYRTVAPDYITVGVGAGVALNGQDPVTGDYTLVRAEDETNIDCTTEAPTFCQSTVGASSRCIVPKRFAVPPSFVDRYSDVDCGGKPDTFCSDSQGPSYVCQANVPSDASPRCSSGTCCVRQRQNKFCATIVSPKTAMVLYSDDAFGQGALATVQDSWVTGQSNFILSTASFDPSVPDSFSDTLIQLFNNAATQEQSLKSKGTLPANHQLADSVVFLFASATDAALFFQEWELQSGQLPDGSDKVFWMATDEVRSPLLTSQVDAHTLRNLFVIDPYSLSDESGDFFLSLFKSRWGRAPDQYSGNAFDAAFITAVAMERAGLIRQHGGSLSKTSIKTAGLDASSAEDIKNSLQPVSLGCTTTTVAQACPNTLVGQNAQDLPAILQALAGGNEVVARGVTGSVGFSPAGDRSNPMNVWKIASDGSPTGFYEVKTLDPIRLAVILKK